MGQPQYRSHRIHHHNQCIEHKQIQVLRQAEQTQPSLQGDFLLFHNRIDIRPKVGGYS